MIAEIGCGGTIGMSLGSKTVVPVLFALLVGGCPKRQTEPRVVYVQPPPATASTSTSQQASAPADILTIEPPLPAPTPAPPPPAAVSTVVPSQPPARRQTRPRTDSHPSEEAEEPETAPTPETAQAPPLEPASSAASEDEIASSQNTIQRRIDALGNGQSFAPADQQILQDARSFLTQSEQALKEHNLLKAQELAGKATLLLDALESKP